MKKVKRDVPGHFIDAANCHFFMHTDILDDGEGDYFSRAKYCVSLIGEWGTPSHWSNLNSSGLTYELAVFDKQSENPWSEIERFCIGNQDEAISKFNELVKKYMNYEPKL